MLDRKSIWCIRQNKPSYVAKDLAIFGVPEKITHRILLARGVYKWFSVRRQLIKLKDVWKSRIRVAHEEIRNTKNRSYLKGYLKAYEEARKEVRVLCHSERWQAPDFDRDAQRFLKELENEKDIL